MLLSEFADTVYFPRVRKTVRSNTLCGYESSYRKYIKPVFGDTDVKDISAGSIQMWIDSFKHPGAARKSYCTLRQILRTARNFDELTEDPTEKGTVRLPKTRGNVNRILTMSEVKQLVHGFKGHPLEACVICSVYLGLRRCESFGLKWSDVNFKTGQVHVSRSRQYVNGKEVVYPPKTTMSRRTCYLPRHVLKRLRTIYKNSKCEWLLPVPVSRAAYMYRKHVLKTKVPYTPFMNLRHTWATLAVESGADISLVAKMMGHADITMTYRRYVKPTEQAYQQVQRNMYNGSLLNRIAELACSVLHICLAFKQVHS